MFSNVCTLWARALESMLSNITHTHDRAGAAARLARRKQKQSTTVSSLNGL